MEREDEDEEKKRKIHELLDESMKGTHFDVIYILNFRFYFACAVITKVDRKCGSMKMLNKFGASLSLELKRYAPGFNTPPPPSFLKSYLCAVNSAICSVFKSRDVTRYMEAI
jgi:hypothetical protein